MKKYGLSLVENVKNGKKKRSWLGSNYRTSPDVHDLATGLKFFCPKVLV